MVRICNVLWVAVVAMGGAPVTCAGADDVSAAGTARLDHGLWDAVLRQHVTDRGLVDYAGIKASSAFDEYVKQLQATTASALVDDDDRLAFWINAYNALTVKAVLQTLPPERGLWAAYKITEQKIEGESLWKGIRFEVGGGRWTLDEIEHEILRKQDGLRDPRIHVALVCAARGCPPLWNRAYSGATVRQQLSAGMMRFVSNPSQCTVDVARRTVKISKVFQWYGGDFVSEKFTPHAESVPRFLAGYFEDASTAAGLRSGSWTVTYFDYDWSLNLQQ